MKNKALLLTIALGIIGLWSFQGFGKSSRMVCIPENLVRSALDQGSLACRYHWATTVLDMNEEGAHYRCYFQFNDNGVKLLTVPEFGKIYQKSLIKQQASSGKDEKNADEKNEKEENVIGFIPAQGALRIKINTNGDPMLVTQPTNSRIFIVFSKPYNADYVAILTKANSKPSTINELGKIVADRYVVETRSDLLSKLPCLGCANLDNECKKK